MNFPRQLAKALAKVVTNQLNWLPAKGGISAYLSPYTLMNGRNIDYNKHLKFPFGAYVQVNNDTTNTLAPRTLGAIYVAPTENLQGGHVVMDLNTGKFITRQTVTKIPMTQLVIDRLNAMAAQQGIKSLKITSQKGRVHPAHWLAGVDGDEDDDKNEEYENDDDDNYDFDDKLDDEEHYDRIDQAEIDEILAEPGS